MAVSPILANGTNSSGAPPIAAAPSSTLDMATFLKLITVQMSSQDPLNPVSDSEFASQLAQLGTVQGMDNLQKSGQVQMAASLLGKTVTASNPNITSTDASTTVTGQVINMTNQSGTYYLGIQDANGNVVNVSMNSIQSVSN